MRLARTIVLALQFTLLVGSAAVAQGPADFLTPEQLKQLVSGRTWVIGWQRDLANAATVTHWDFKADGHRLLSGVASEEASDGLGSSRARRPFATNGGCTAGCCPSPSDGSNALFSGHSNHHAGGLWPANSSRLRLSPRSSVSGHSRRRTEVAVAVDARLLHQIGFRSRNKSQARATTSANAVEGSPRVARAAHRGFAVTALSVDTLCENTV